MMKRHSRLPRKSRYELCVYHGDGGLWTRIKAVDSIAEAEQYLKDKTFHSAELCERKPPKVVRKFRGSRLMVRWLQ